MEIQEIREEQFDESAGRPRDSRLNRPQIAAKKAKVGRVTFFPLARSRGWLRDFCFHLISPGAANPSFHTHPASFARDNGRLYIPKTKPDCQDELGEITLRGAWCGRAAKSLRYFLEVGIDRATYIRVDMWQRRWSSTR